MQEDMRRDQEHARDLDRAYIQSRVIENGLEQLAVTLEDVDPAIRQDVSACAEQFETCVHQLRDAQRRTTPDPPKRAAVRERAAAKR